MHYAYTNRTDNHPTTKGDYAVWKSETGIQWWIHLKSGSLEVLEFQTHYAGNSRMSVRIDKAIPRPELSELAGAFHVWANPTDDSDQPGDFPFVFDAPDFSRHMGTAFPILTEVQLAAFPHALDVYQSLDEFQKAQAGRESKLAERAFIPTGLFNVPDGQFPRSEAIFTGQVISAHTRINPITKHKFISATVDTYGGTIDLISELNEISDQIRTGSTICTSAQITGLIKQLTSPPPLPIRS